MTTADLQLAEPPATPPHRRASATPLHPGTDPPLAPAEIARWIAPQIAERIERAASKLGDYCVYALIFPPLRLGTGRVFFNALTRGGIGACCARASSSCARTIASPGW